MDSNSSVVNSKTSNALNSLLDETKANSGNLMNSNSLAMKASSQKVWGRGVQVTSGNLKNDMYSVLVDKNNATHLTWVETITSNEDIIYYTFSNDIHLNNWSERRIILRCDYSIKEYKMVIDSNNNLRLFYFLEDTPFSKIYQLYKLNNSEEWSNEEVFSTTTFDLSSLDIQSAENGTLNVVWLATTKDSTKEQWNSSIHYCHFTNYSIRSIECHTICSNTNPVLVRLLRQECNPVTLLPIHKDNVTQNHSIWKVSYNSTGSTWTNESLVVAIDDEIEDLLSFEDNDQTIHFLWENRENYFELCYGYLLSNNTFYSDLEPLNNEKTSIFSFDYYYDETTDSIYTFYEERIVIDQIIYYRKNENNNLTWSPRINITQSNQSSTIRLANPYSENNLQLFWLEEDSITTTNISLEDGFIEESTMIKKSTSLNYLPEIITDSSGKSVMIWMNEDVGEREILIQTREINESSWSHTRILSSDLTDEGNPNLICDSNDTLYCFFSAKENESAKRKIYYLIKNKNNTSWSPVQSIATNGNYVSDGSPKIIFDQEENLYVFWIEWIDEYSEIIYSVKPFNHNEFNPPIKIENKTPYSYAYHVEIKTDSDNTLHLTNGEYSIEDELFQIVYRKISTNGTIVKDAFVDASYDPITKPQLLFSVSGNIEITASYYEHGFTNFPGYTCDIRLYEGLSNGAVWHLKGRIVEESSSLENYDLIQIPNGTCYIIFYDAVYYYYFSWDVKSNYLSYMKRDAEGFWGSIVTINPDNVEVNPMNVFYNSYSDNIEGYLLDKSKISWFGTQNDADNDQLGDIDEYYYATDPNAIDSDLDGLDDGIEVHLNRTNPLFPDTDWDGLLDGEEVLEYLSNPLDRDSDSDYITDGDEIKIYGTNPNQKDTDEDSINDYKEIFQYGTNPLLADTDNDGMPDFYEVTVGLNATLANGNEDEDDDNLTNLEEYTEGTNVFTADTDGDFLLDGEEVKEWKTDPLDADTDGDTLTDWEEVTKYQTSPLSKDTDKDGFSDRDEINSGTDPLNKKDNIRRNRIIRILLSTVIPIPLVIIILVIIEVNYRVKKRKLEKSEKAEYQAELAKIEEVQEVKSIKTKIQNSKN
jgi:hypothetical protein